MPPQVTKRLPKIPATAGKVLRFTIPVETFSDAEDGNAAKLQLDLLSEDGKPLEEEWIGFNSSTRVITINAEKARQRLNKEILHLGNLWVTSGRRYRQICVFGASAQLCKPNSK